MTKLRENGGYEAEKKERETEKHDEKRWRGVENRM
jgi:hypothetical protein